MDVSSIQTYIINSARVVFLNERPHPRSNKGKEDKARSERSRAASDNAHSECAYCARILQSENNNYCSISCKMNGGDCMVPKAGVDMSFAEETIKPTRGRARKRRAPRTIDEAARGLQPAITVARALAVDHRYRSRAKTNRRTVATVDRRFSKSPPGALLVGSKRKHPASRGDAPATPAPLLITPSVLHRRKSRPKSPVGDH